MSGETRADGRADCRDFVLSLKSFDAKIFVTRKFVQDVRRWGDGIRAVEQRPSCQFSRRYKADCGRFVAGNFSITSRRDDRFPDGEMRREDFSGFSEVITRLQCDLIGLRQFWILPELCVDPIKRWIKRPIIKPIKHAQRKEVLASIDLFA